MLKDAFLGCLIMVLAITFMIYLIFWSRKTIELIHKKKLKSAREIMKNMNEKK